MNVTTKGGEYSLCSFSKTTERISPRKVGLVVDLIRGMEVKSAIDQLSFMKVRAAPIVKKVICSAIANALHNKGIADDKEMKVIQAVVGSGGSFRRGRPGSRGPAPILRRLSKIHIALGVRVQ